MLKLALYFAFGIMLIGMGTAKTAAHMVLRKDTDDLSFIGMFACSLGGLIIFAMLVELTGAEA